MCPKAGSRPGLVTPPKGERSCDPNAVIGQTSYSTSFTSSALLAAVSEVAERSYCGVNLAVVRRPEPAAPCAGSSAARRRGADRCRSCPSYLGPRSERAPREALHPWWGNLVRRGPVRCRPWRGGASSTPSFAAVRGVGRRPCRSGHRGPGARVHPLLFAVAAGVRACTPSLLPSMALLAVARCPCPRCAAGGCWWP